MTSGRPGQRFWSLATAALAAVTLTACGAGDPKPGPEVAGGNAGVDEQVGSGIKVLDVEVEYPLDGRYEPGDDARLYLAVSNTGAEPDALVAVTGPDFAESRAGGTGLPIPVPKQDTVYIGAEGEPTLTLTDLERALRSSQSIPVTLRFEEAGPVTVEAVVAAEGQTPTPTYDFPDPAEDPST